MKLVAVLFVYIITFAVTFPSKAGYEIHIMDLKVAAKSYLAISFKHKNAENTSISGFDQSPDNSGYQLLFQNNVYGNAFSNSYLPEHFRPEGLDQFVKTMLRVAQEWIDQTYLDRGVVGQNSELSKALIENERLDDQRSSFVIITEVKNPLKIVAMLRSSYRGSGRLEKLPMELSLNFRFPRPESRLLLFDSYDYSYNRGQNGGDRPKDIIPFMIHGSAPDGHHYNNRYRFQYGDITELKNLAISKGFKDLFPVLFYIAEISNITREGQETGIQSVERPGVVRSWKDMPAAFRRDLGPPEPDYRVTFDYTQRALPSTYVIECKGEMVGYYSDLGFQPVDENLKVIHVPSSSKVRAGKLFKMAISREGFVGLLRKIGVYDQNYPSLNFKLQLLEIRTRHQNREWVDKAVRGPISCQSTTSNK